MSTKGLQKEEEWKSAAKKTQEDEIHETTAKQKWHKKKEQINKHLQTQRFV